METDADVREAVTITLQNIVSTIADTETKTTFDEMRTEDYRLHTFTHKVQADLKEALQAEKSDRKAESDTTNERLTSEVARVESETTAKFDKEISDRQASEKAMNTRSDEDSALVLFSHVRGVAASDAASRSRRAHRSRRGGRVRLLQRPLSLLATKS